MASITKTVIKITSGFAILYGTSYDCSFMSLHTPTPFKLDFEHHRAGDFPSFIIHGHQTRHQNTDIPQISTSNPCSVLHHACSGYVDFNSSLCLSYVSPRKVSFPMSIGSGQTGVFFSLVWHACIVAIVFTLTFLKSFQSPSYPTSSERAARNGVLLKR
jgi:hypothetical protein